MPSNPRSSTLITRLVILVAVVLAVMIWDFWPRREAAPARAGSSILCTFLPVYVFALNVVGNIPDLHVELMVSPDVGCPHHYTVRPADHMKLSRADVVVANGLGMETFLDELLPSHPAKKVITISDECAVLEGRCRHAHEAGDTAGHDHAHGPNGHVWVSPKEAAAQVMTLARKLGELFPAHRDRFDGNARAYVTRLEALQMKMKEAGAGFSNRRIVTMHDAFDYLARDLGLEVVGLLQVEPEQSPTAHQMAELVDIIKREKAAAVFYEPSSLVRVAETVARDAGVPAFELNPFTSFAGKPEAASYEEMMEKNLTILKQALGGGS